MKRTLLPLALVFALALVGQPKTTLHFDMVAISPAKLYSEASGYGYEKPAVGEPPYYFSIRVPDEGNYRVTVRLGSPSVATTTTIKAELRRLMVERVDTKPGEFVTRSFIVNMRRPQIPGGGIVKLKDREKASEAWAWDDKLTLEFTNVHPGVTAIDIEKADAIPTLYIASDSTSTDQPLEPYNSWGQMITALFKPGIGVANHGESGESLRGFLGERRWAKVMSTLKPGDYLLIQMGHNDQKEKGEGVGAKTTYKIDLKRMVAEARERGAAPIVVTPVNRLTFGSDGKITNSLGDYPEAVLQVAAEEHIALIDLNAMSKRFYEALGPANANRAFAGKDTTHHDNYGSYELAKCVAQGLKGREIPFGEVPDRSAALRSGAPRSACLILHPSRTGCESRNVTAISSRPELIRSFSSFNFPKT